MERNYSRSVSHRIRFVVQFSQQEKAEEGVCPMKTQKYREYSLRFYYEVAGVRCEVLSPQKNVLQTRIFRTRDEAERWGHDWIDRFIRENGSWYSQGGTPFAAQSDSPFRAVRRSKRTDRGATVPVVTILLILANVIVFLLEEFTGGSNGDNAVSALGVQYVPAMIHGHQWWRLFTSMFIHFGFRHIFSNMITLAYCGWSLEQQYGRARYLILYLASGIGGNLLSLAVDIAAADYSISAGASGAVFGLIGAYAGAAVMDRKKTNRRANPWLMILFSVLTFFQSIGAGVNSWAHLGGMLTGFLLGMVLRDNDRNGRAD